jgi:integrase
MTENLKDLISKSRPQAKETTIKMYVSNLNKLMKIFEADNLNFLNDVEKVKEKLEDKHYTTQRNYYNSIIVYLMSKDKKQKLIEKYNDIRDELNKKYTDEQSSGVISEKQKKSFIPLSELKNMIEQIKKDLNIPQLKKKEISSKEYKLLQIYVILEILVRIPMRNDLSNLIKITRREYNKLTDKQKEENNYLVIDKTKMEFIMNDYKTSKKYKEKVITIPKDLEKIIRMYIRKNGDSKNLFPMSRNAMSQALIKTSKKYLDKSISTTMIRKIVASDLLKDVKKKEQELSNKMGTDIDTIKSVYVKKGD